MEAGENIHQLVWETKNRKKVFGEMKAMGIYDNDGLFRGIRGIFRDITEGSGTHGSASEITHDICVEGN